MGGRRTGQYMPGLPVPSHTFGSESGTQTLVQTEQLLSYIFNLRQCQRFISPTGVTPQLQFLLLCCDHVFMTFTSFSLSICERGQIEARHY